MSDALLNFRQPMSEKHEEASDESGGSRSSDADDHDAYCSVTSGNLQDEVDALKHQLSEIEEKLREYQIRSPLLHEEFDNMRSTISSLQESLESEKSKARDLATSLSARTDEYFELVNKQMRAVESTPTAQTDHASRLQLLSSENTELKYRITQLEEELRETKIDDRKHEDSETAIAQVKNQYDIKLKEFMDRARDHAKKIALERDDYRRQSEEKDAILIQFKKEMVDQVTSNQMKDKRIDELQSKSDELLSKLAHIESKSKIDLVSATPICVFHDTMKWILVEVGNEKTWINMDAGFSGWNLENLPHVSISEIEKLNEKLAAKEAEFLEYKNKAQSAILQSRPTGSTTPPVGDMDTVRKLLKAEDDLAKANVTNQKLQKRVHDLETSEADLRKHIDREKTSASRLCKEIEDLTLGLDHAYSDKTRLLSELETSHGVIEDLRKKIRELNTEKAMQELVLDQSQEIETQTVGVSAIASPVVSVTKLAVCDTGSQTVPIVEDPPLQTNRLAPLTLLAAHDSIAIPLRQKIRELTELLEVEKSQHGETKVQLCGVKEELRKIISDRSFIVDSNDATRIEYMRNVGRKFFSLLPPRGGLTDELEQLFPVILSLFQLSNEEVHGLVVQRRQQAGSNNNGTASSSIVNSFSIPKIW
jgi:hypothetical protein